MLPFSNLALTAEIQHCESAIRRYQCRVEREAKRVYQACVRMCPLTKLAQKPSSLIVRNPFILGDRNFRVHAAQKQLIVGNHSRPTASDPR
jgi:hypothetical protein